MPDISKIMVFPEPLYRVFRRAAEKLMASFSGAEIGVIGIYLSKSIGLMDDAIAQLDSK